MSQTYYRDTTCNVSTAVILVTQKSVSHANGGKIRNTDSRVQMRNVQNTEICVT